MSGARSPLDWHASPQASGRRGWALAGVALVLLAHLGVAAVALWWPAKLPVADEVRPISVSLLTSAAPAAAQPVATPPKPLPVPTKPAPSPVQPRTAPAPQAMLSAATSNQSMAVPPPVPKPVTPTPAPAVQPVLSPAPALPAPAAPVSPAAPESPRPATVPKVLSASAVRYLVEPVLSYPRASRDLGESGTVVLKVLVDEQGRPKEVEVAKSSGYARLDQQAVSAMRRARFQPHIEDGAPRPVWVMAPQTFALDEQ